MKNMCFNIFKKTRINDSESKNNKEIMWKELKPFDINSDKLEYVPFPANQYVAQTTDKKQVVLHHTVSDPDYAQGDLSYWLSTTERVATAVVLQGDGKVFQCFSSKLWGYHIGSGNWNLDAHSIGVEIDNWGLA
jgi:N-acetyl-anhydromuramyl-L-alanine amidase AmpD